MIVGCAYTSSSASTVIAQHFLAIVRSACGKSRGSPGPDLKGLVGFERDHSTDRNRRSELLDLVWVSLTMEIAA